MIVLKSSIAKILIFVLFLKIMLNMDFDDFFIHQFFSRFFSTFPQTPVAHQLKIAGFGHGQTSPTCMWDKDHCTLPVIVVAFSSFFSLFF
jgi:hypothetical protein